MGMETETAAAEPETKSEVDRRGNRRSRILKAGKLLFDAHQTIINCVIRDISPLGARIRLSDTLHLPSELELLVVREAELHPAKVLWKSQTDCGLVFTGPPQSARSLKI